MTKIIPDNRSGLRTKSRLWIRISGPARITDTGLRIRIRNPDPDYEIWIGIILVVNQDLPHFYTDNFSRDPGYTQYSTAPLELRYQLPKKTTPTTV